MNNAPKCSKCQSEMEVGYVLDHGEGNSRQPTMWVEGEPVRSIWMGTKIAGKALHQIHTFRCPECGYLESYAH